jgi:hypothetical protein
MPKAHQIILEYYQHPILIKYYKYNSEKNYTSWHSSRYVRSFAWNVDESQFSLQLNCAEPDGFEHHLQ